MESKAGALQPLRRPLFRSVTPAAWAASASLFRHDFFVFRPKLPGLPRRLAARNCLSNKLYNHN